MAQAEKVGMAHDRRFVWNGVSVAFYRYLDDWQTHRLRTVQPKDRTIVPMAFSLGMTARQFRQSPVNRLGILTHYRRPKFCMPKHTPMIERRLRQFRRQHCGSVRIDETYIKIRGKWRYLHRAIDKHGNPVDSADGEARSRSR